MELIQKIVPLEDVISRKSPLNLDGKTISLGADGCIVIQTKDVILSNAIDIDFNWGKIVVDTIALNIFLTQNIDDIGIFLDAEYVDEEPDYTPLQQYYQTTLTGLTWTTPLPHNTVFIGPYSIDQELLYRLRGQTVTDYFYSGGFVTGLTSSMLSITRNYNQLNPYQIGQNLNSNPTQYFTGVLSVTSTPNSAITYIIDGQLVSYPGTTIIPNTGIKYIDEPTIRRTYYDNLFNIDRRIIKTTFMYNAPGWNNTNISLSAITKDELDLGIVFPREIDNDVFIDRGAVSVEESQMRLSEIRTLSQLMTYGNKFYKINTQY